MGDYRRTAGRGVVTPAIRTLRSVLSGQVLLHLFSNTMGGSVIIGICFGTVVGVVIMKKS